MSDFLKKIEQFKSKVNEEEIIEVERGTKCFNKLNFMENEATQNLRDFIRQLVDSLVTPFIHKMSLLESKLEKWGSSIDKERTELKELVAYIKQYELVKEQEIKNLFLQLETIQETLKNA